MHKHLWLAAGLTFALSASAMAQLPGIDAPTGAGIGSRVPRDSSDRSGAKAAEPAKPSDMAPREGAAANRNAANADGSGNAGAQGSAVVPGSAQGKIEGSEPADSGVGRSGPGTASGMTTGGGEAVK